MPQDLLLEAYNPASEITVLAVCIVMLVLLFFSFKVRMKSFRIFAVTLWMLIAAASADLALHALIRNAPDTPRVIIYGLRSLYHILLFCMLHHFVVYACTATALTKKERRPYIAAATALLVMFSTADTVGIFTGRSMHIEERAISFKGSLIFTLGYALYLILLAVLLIRVRHRLFRRVMNEFFGVMIIGVALLGVARVLHQSTYTISTFLFPMIAVMYLMHSNPYDAMLGANDLRGLNNLIRYSDERGKNYLFLSLYLWELDESGKTMSDALRTMIRHSAESYYRGSALFQVSNGHVMLSWIADFNDPINMLEMWTTVSGNNDAQFGR